MTDKEVQKSQTSVLFRAQSKFLTVLRVKEPPYADQRI